MPDNLFGYFQVEFQLLQQSPLLSEACQSENYLLWAHFEIFTSMLWIKKGESLGTLTLCKNRDFPSITWEGRTMYTALRYLVVGWNKISQTRMRVHHHQTKMQLASLVTEYQFLFPWELYNMGCNLFQSTQVRFS